MRIRYITNPHSINSNYRAYQPMMELGRRGHECEYNRPGEPVFPLRELLRADVVHVHRQLMPETIDAMRGLREAGVPVLWDNDDDIANVPRENPNYALLGGKNARGVRQMIGEIVRLANVVTTPSERLAEQFSAAGAAEVRVIENYLPREFPEQRAISHDGVVVAWLAGLEHQLDYQRLRLRETLERLLDADPAVRVLSIGLGLGLSDRSRYTHHRAVEFYDLPRALAAADIGIAPLVDVPWNQARSNVKLKEYGAAGLPWLASPVGGYPQLGADEGGRLVADDDWFDAITALIADARGRRKLAKRARKWAKRQTIDRHVDAWEQAYEAAIASARSARARDAPQPSHAR